jgi:3-dehydroquinate dehydratase/shikimate dehydrogenase
VKILVNENELGEFIQLAKQIPVSGLSITRPLKECILPNFNDIDSRAKKIGAVNTLHFENGGFKGYNTDGIGALNAIENVVSVKGKRIIMIGAGGATKAIAYEALQRGAKVTILNRHVDKAVKIAEQLGCEGKGLDKMVDCTKAGYDILINCTPVEMPIDVVDILPQAVVMDIKTKPKNTELLNQAIVKGCQVIYGYHMFVEQAVGQFQLWFDDRINANQCKEFFTTKAEECI